MPTPSTPPDAAVAQLRTEVEALRAELEALRSRRLASRRKGALALVAVGALAAAGLAHASTLTDGLYVFVANEPAVASEINTNFSTLRQYLRNKVGNDLLSQNVAVPGTLSAGATTVSSFTTGGSVSAGSLNVTGTTSLAGYQLSCGESSYTTTLAGYAFCCQLNERTGETKCNVATNGNGATWSSTSFGYPNLGATTPGRYHLSCVAGAPGANFPFCCRMDANTGATVCGQGNSYNLGSSGNSSVPF
ncbi:MAG: hypothetical protein K1X89_20825 [Myxococcaceae bacterium]|nr:hypothetical protein [Myxococcaceae bacterium]